MKALFELFRRFDARRIFGFIRRLGGMSRPKVKCYDLRSTRALRVEGDGLPNPKHAERIRISIHALRVEGDFRENISVEVLREFLSTPSGWRATRGVLRNAVLKVISIHALRVEGDPSLTIMTVSGAGFLSTPSGWRATARSAAKRSATENFYPRPPGGGQRRCARAHRQKRGISIHALRVEGDQFDKHGRRSNT